MPIYDFKCDECDVVVEKMQHHSDPAPHCPSCNKEMKRLMGTPSVRIVGRKGYHKDTGDWAS